MADKQDDQIEAQIDAIRAALIEGEASGEARSFDVEAFKQAMYAAHNLSVRSIK